MTGLVGGCWLLSSLKKLVVDVGSCVSRLTFAARQASRLEGNEILLLQMIMASILFDQRSNHYAQALSNQGRNQPFALDGGFFSLSIRHDSVHEFN